MQDEEIGRDPIVTLEANDVADLDVVPNDSLPIGSLAIVVWAEYFRLAIIFRLVHHVAAIVIVAFFEHGYSNEEEERNDGGVSWSPC